MTKEEKREYMRRWWANHPNYRVEWMEKNGERYDRLQKDWKKANLDKVKASYSRWRESHKVQESLRWKKWYVGNRTQLLKRKAKIRKENPDVVHAIDKRNYERSKSNPEFIQANRDRVKKYKKEHPEFRRHHGHKRRARVRGSRVGKDAVIRRFIAAIHRATIVSCYYCGCRFPGKKAHVDHVVPIARGGAHDITNLCCSCAKCNIDKGAKLPSEFVSNGQALLLV